MDALLSMTGISLRQGGGKTASESPAPADPCPESAG